MNVAPSAKEKFVDSKCTNGFESYDLCSTVNQASLSKVLRSRREEEEEGVCVKMEQLLQITFTNRPEGNSFFSRLFLQQLLLNCNMPQHKRELQKYL